MKVMTLAAGHEKRMRPLTDNCPKPLLQVGKKPLVDWYLRHLKQIGIIEITINHARPEEKVEETLGNDCQYGVKTSYSPERNGGLETAGEIVTALPLLGDESFLVVNGGMPTDINFQTTLQVPDALMQQRESAYLRLASSPSYNPDDDFVLDPDGRIYPDNKAEGKTLTFSDIDAYQPILFKNTSAHQTAKLTPLLRIIMNDNSVIGERHNGLWSDVGTAERLKTANKLAKNWQ